MREKIIQIIDMLYQVTKSDEMVWLENNLNNDKRDHKRNMYAIGEDGTRFEISIEYTIVDEKFVMNSSPGMWIKSPELPGGSQYVYGYKDVVKLRDIIKDKYCSDMNPKISDVEDKLDNILKNISVRTNRDNKLTKLLNKIL